MATGADIPNEVLTDIAAYIHPGDVVNFARTCKRFHDVAGSALQRHRLYQKRFGVITSFPATYTSCMAFNADFKPGKQMIHLAGNLFNLYDDPRKAAYVRRMVIGALRQSPTDAHSTDQNILQSMQRLIGHILGPTFQQRMLPSGMNMIRKHDSTAIVGLLLCLVPNLEVLQWRGDALGCNIEPIRTVLHCVKKKPELKLLSNLKTLDLQTPRITKGLSVSCKLIDSFMQLPSLKTLILGEVCEPSRNRKKTHQKKRTSNVTDLQFISNCFLDEEYCWELENILSMTKQLKECHFIGPRWVDPTKEPRRVFHTGYLARLLLPHARYSLESLSIRSPTNEALPISTLKGFDNLKSLEVDYRMLFFEGCGTGKEIRREILPLSLHSLGLRGFEREEHSSMRYMPKVKEMLGMKGQLPRINELTMQLSDDGDGPGQHDVFMEAHKGADDMEAFCKERGTKFRAFFALDRQWTALDSVKI